MTVKLIEVIMVGSDRGDGGPANPRRAVWQYWSTDGRLLADVDTAGLDIPVDAIGYRLAEAIARVRELEDELARREVSPPAERRSDVATPRDPQL